jgi:two-component system nitrate/nitrite response regulator NarL
LISISPDRGNENRYNLQPMALLRVIAADDHPLFLFAVGHAVRARPELELVGEAASGAEALAMLREHRPELAVLDVAMPDMTGLEVLQALTRDGLATRVLFVTGGMDSALAYDLVQAGAAGVLQKDALPQEIGEALVRIARGETVLAPSVQAALVSGVRERASPRSCSPRVSATCCAASRAGSQARRSPPSCISARRRSRRTCSGSTSGWACPTAPRPSPRACGAG